ncbi:MAG: hypothetical protein ISS28_08175 [Candidatus Cloacimonetes bacterium]|nr:hypothetical protein [Candidatus Cloacimonadota bacterium]
MNNNIVLKILELVFIFIGTIVYGAIFIIFGIININILQKNLETPDEFYYLNKPNLNLVGLPKIQSVQLLLKEPTFPRYLRIDTTKYKESPKLKTEIPFIVKEKKKPKRKVYLSNKLTHVNPDSLIKISDNINTINAFIFLNIELKIVNSGNVTANNFVIFFGDTLNTNTFFRDMLLSDRLNNDNIIWNNTNRFELKSVKPHDTITIKLDKIKPTFLNVNNEFIIHVIILYTGHNNRIYDSYFLIKCKLIDKEYYFIYEPIYKLHDKNIFKLKSVVRHYRPTKPKLEDLVNYIDYFPYYEFVYNKSESEKIYETFFINDQ